jgi:hypothetical protein
MFHYDGRLLIVGAVLAALRSGRLNRVEASKLCCDYNTWCVKRQGGTYPDNQYRYIESII